MHAQIGHVSTSLAWHVRLRTVGRKFCHFTPCHESLAINAPNKMCLPIKRTFNDFFALTKKKLKWAIVGACSNRSCLDWHVRLRMEEH